MIKFKDVKIIPQDTLVNVYYSVNFTTKDNTRGYFLTKLSCGSYENAFNAYMANRYEPDHRDITISIVGCTPDELDQLSICI